MTNHAFPVEIKTALLDSVQDIDAIGVADSSINTYVPNSHARALQFENIIVEGIRGAGKSHWWSVLNSEKHRVFLASVFPETRIDKNIKISQGFGLGRSKKGEKGWPSKRTLKKLQADYEAEAIWMAITAVHLNFASPFPAEGKWAEQVAWVTDHPEEFDELLEAVDDDYSDNNQKQIILFDALDRLADDWEGIRPLAKALFQWALELRSTYNIRLKLFVRPDMLQDKAIIAFPDSSKLLAKKVSLNWQRADLYALLFQRLINHPKFGRIFRDHCRECFGIGFKKERESRSWKLPDSLQHDEAIQREVFHALAGPAMGKGKYAHKRGYPYTWLPNHLLDGLGQVSPRSFIKALHGAVSYEHSDVDWRFILHFKGIHEGVQQASSIRVNEITNEDYPWVEPLMDALRKGTPLSVPCEEEAIFERWQEQEVVEKLQDEITSGNKNAVKLPPVHTDEGAKGILQDLLDLGVMQRLWDDRIQMPDVYRVGFGLKRRGGVKPLR